MHEKKYAVYPGWVVSQHDGEYHYITADELIRLYGVPYSECVVIRDKISLTGRDVSQLIALRPKYKGNYTIEGE